MFSETYLISMSKGMFQTAFTPHYPFVRCHVVRTLQVMLFEKRIAHDVRVGIRGVSSDFEVKNIIIQTLG